MKEMSNETVAGRRNFLARAIQLAAVTSPFLSACGGGGSSHGDSGVDVPPGTTLMTGQVTLPAPLSVAGATVSLLVDQAVVTASGAFEVGVVDGSATFAKVTDAAGNVLVFGYLRAEQPVLSVRSTAEALVFRGLGLWAHAPAVRIAALTLLKAENLGTVEVAVTAAISAGGAAWMTSAMTGLGTAVMAKVTAMIGTAPSGTSAKVTAAGMIVSPTARVSGLILEGDGIGACTVTYQFRRRALLAHTQTKAKLETGSEFSIPENLIRTEIAPIDGLSSPLGAVADLFFERKSLYTPVTVTLDTPRMPDTAIYAKYKVYGIGPGTSPGHWNDLPSAVTEAAVIFIFKSIVLDFVVPLICSLVIPLEPKAIDVFAKKVGDSAKLKDLITGLALVPSLVDLVVAGRFTDACQAVAIYIRNTSQVQSAMMEGLTLVLEDAWGPSVVDRDGKTVVFREFIDKAYGGIDKVLGLGEFAFTLFDSAIQALDIGSSSLVEEWDVNVTRAKVTLAPKDFFIEKGQLFSGIAAIAQDVTQGEGVVFGYTWKCSAGHLSTSSKYGAFIDSSLDSSVAYDAASVPAGTVDQIEVDVFVSRGGGTDPVGSARSKVYVTAATVTPDQKAKLKANETVTLTAATVGMRPLVGAERVVYKWTLGGTAGTLDATDAATATFKADAAREGLAVVTVEAFLGEQRIGIATSNLTVGDKLIVAGRLFEVHFKDENCHTGMYIAVPKIEGATRYIVFVSGMRGPVFGTSYTWTIFVNQDGSVNPAWTLVGNEYTTGIGGGGGGGADCVDAPDGRWAAWYEGSTVEVTVLL